MTVSEAISQDQVERQRELEELARERQRLVDAETALLKGILPLQGYHASAGLPKQEVMRCRD